MIEQFLSRTPNHVSIEGMSTDDWLQKRREGIGGSDAGSIMGLSDYGSRLTVFCQKKGIGEKGTEARAARRGKILEPVIHEFTKNDFPNLKFARVPYMFFSEKHPFMLANVDGIIWAESNTTIENCTVDGWGGHEIKSSKSGYGFSKDEVPDSYYAQVQHYMEVLDLQWFLLSVYILENEEVRHYPILRNQEFIDDMVSQEKDFWENSVQKDNMPPAIGIDSEEDMITGMFTGSAPLALDESSRELCGRYVTLGQQIKALEDERKAVKIDLMADIVEQAHDGEPEEWKVLAVAGPYSVSFYTAHRKDIDRQALKQAGLYEKFLKTISYSLLRVTEKKGA